MRKPGIVDQTIPGILKRGKKMKKRIAFITSSINDGY